MHTCACKIIWHDQLDKRTRDNLLTLNPETSSDRRTAGRRVAVGRVLDTARARHRAQLAHALLRWACAATALAAQAAAAPLARKLRASQALVEQLRASQGKAEARQQRIEEELHAVLRCSMPRPGTASAPPAKDGTPSVGAGAGGEAG